MKVTGNRLRAAIKLWETRLQVASQTFETQTHQFPGEKKDPDAAMARIASIHETISRLQTAQARYNLAVVCSLSDGTTMTLCEAVKRVGMAGQSAKLWRSSLPKRDRYASRYGPDVTRKEDEQYAEPVLSYEDMAERAFEAQRYANDLQSAIATANATEMDVAETDVPESLLA